LRRRVSWKKFALLVGMSIFGLWASSMVLVVYYTLHKTLPFCTNTSSTGFHWPPRVDCGAVLSSPYSSILGVPLEVLAVGYFVVALGLIYMVSFGPDSTFRTSFRTLFVWRFIGLAMVPYLLLVELGILGAICIYCTMMHIAIVTDFVIISYLLFYKKSIGTYGQAPGTGSLPPTNITGQEDISAP
jgi:uncharacterized membrane protein